MRVAGKKRGKLALACESGMFLVLLVIGRESGASFLSQSLILVVQNQSKRELLQTPSSENYFNFNFQFDLTPLHLASEKGNLQAVKILLNNPYSQAEPNKSSRVSSFIFV